MKKLLISLSLLTATSVMIVLLNAAEITADDNPASIRVVCPKDYRTSFRAIRSGYFAERKLITTTYANAQAMQVLTPGQLPYPNGSVFVFEYSEARWAEDGTPLRDSDGMFLKGNVVRLDVMERGSGFGEVYGEDRAGEWEFASFQPDGTPLTQAWPDSPGVPPAAPAKCAACHARVATRDFVFAGRFPLFTGEQ